MYYKKMGLTAISVGLFVCSPLIQIPAYAQDDSVAELKSAIDDAQQEIADLKKRRLPEGAVIAFLRNPGQACPDGWSYYTPAQGRFLIGAGEHTNRDERNEELDQYTSGTVGGEKNHVLTEDEMPSHYHPPGVLLTSGDNLGKAPPTGGIGSNARRETNRVGGGKPHNNMPPYVAVHFCQQDRTGN